MNSYQITSMQQREEISKVLQGQKLPQSKENVELSDVSPEEGNVSDAKDEEKLLAKSECNCNCKALTQQQLGQIIAKLVKENKHKG